MVKVTTKEKKELIENIKTPVRYYRITIRGYGSEQVYGTIHENQYKFWKGKNLEDYMCQPEEYVMETKIPEFANFLKDPEEGYYYDWHDSPNVDIHDYGVDYYTSNIDIEEVKSLDYSAKTIDTVIDNIDLKDLSKVKVKHGFVEHDAEYSICYVSLEKGTFFEGTFQTAGRINLKKLKIFTNELPNGDTVVSRILYDGYEVDNEGGDTRGKGSMAHVWGPGD